MGKTIDEFKIEIQSQIENGIVLRTHIKDICNYADINKLDRTTTTQTILEGCVNQDTIDKVLEDIKSY